MNTLAPSATESQNEITSVDFHARQVGTTEKSAVARLDRVTEEKLYQLYRGYFQQAENTRNGNLWEEIAWDTTPNNPPPTLVTEVLAAYDEHLFQPDYSSEALKTLRSSRGRAWFLTRWSYEEMKHSLILSEWLVHAGAITDDALKARGDNLLRHYGWQLPISDPPAVFADMLVWEQREIHRIKSIQALAEKVGDRVLVGVAEHLLRDEKAHEEFLQSALNILSENYGPHVEDALRRVLENQES